MSALARYFNAMGKSVSGYDKTSTKLTDELIAEGIDVHFDDTVELPWGPNDVDFNENPVKAANGVEYWGLISNATPNETLESISIDAFTAGG